MRPAPLVVCLLLASCSPSININVIPPEDDLRPQRVFADDAAHASHRVAMIDVRGMILDSRAPGLILDGPNPVDRFCRALELAEKDSSVRAVIIRINSPGGTVTGSDIMYQELRRFRRVTGKPVVASLGEIATSGGYYLALGADHIVAQPTSVTASIGVIMPTFNFSEGMGMIGIHARSIKSGANKDMANPFEPIRESQYEVLQSMVDNYYARFRALVIERRPALNPKEVPNATDGRVVTGEQALDLGLVDELGGVRDAFERAKTLANLQAATLVKYTTGGNGPRTMYASADAPPTPPEVNLLKVTLPGLPAASTESPGFYYLWSPN